MLASLLIITLQLPLAASPGEWAPCASCRWAFCCCRLPLPAWRYRRRPTRRRLAAVNAGGWFCHAAHPRPDAVSARSQGSDPLFAEESTLGAHYGALATAGGCAVLAGNLLLGHLLDQRSFPRRRRFILASAGAVSAVAPSPCGRSVARWRQHDAERVTARSGSEPTIKYTAWEDNGRPALLCRQLATNNLGAGAQGVQFAGRDMARQRRHTAVGGRVEFVGIDERQRLAQGSSHLFRGFDSMAGDIDRPTITFYRGSTPADPSARASCGTRER